jgi:hypothetical protein
VHVERRAYLVRGQDAATARSNAEARSRQGIVADGFEEEWKVYATEPDTDHFEPGEAPAPDAPTDDPAPRVLVTVRSGVAYVEADPDVRVCHLDYDDEPDAPVPADFADLAREPDAEGAIPFDQDPEAIAFVHGADAADPVDAQGDRVFASPLTEDARRWLADDMAEHHGTHGPWRFAYDYPGIFTYTTDPEQGHGDDGLGYRVSFTPEYDEPGVIPVQIENAEGEAGGGYSIPFDGALTHRRLFDYIRPVLDRLAK